MGRNLVDEAVGKSVYRLTAQMQRKMKQEWFWPILEPLLMLKYCEGSSIWPGTD